MRRPLFLPLPALLLSAFFILLPVGCAKNYTLGPQSVLSSSVAQVTTLAGQAGVTGATNATGTNASFNYPAGVAVDALGNVYVADTSNNMIRKITAGGVVETLAGTVGVTGATNATGTAASFNMPVGIAVDSAGNLYVADKGNNMIRKITSGGVVTTLAGSGAFGFANGTGTAAVFLDPDGVAVDTNGNVYVGDSCNDMIRKITSTGVVTTLAGSGTAGFVNGTGTAASFFEPGGVAVDSSGNVYVGDVGNSVIRKITPGGVVTTLAGSGSVGFANGPATVAMFYEPYDIAVDSGGNVYVADAGNNMIRKITSNGVVTTLAGGGPCCAVNAFGIAASFGAPSGVAVDTSENVYVADEGDNLIRKIQ